jgi:hypothetical protein
MGLLDLLGINLGAGNATDRNADVASIDADNVPAPSRPLRPAQQHRTAAGTPEVRSAATQGHAELAANSPTGHQLILQKQIEDRAKELGAGTKGATSGRVWLRQYMELRPSGAIEETWVEDSETSAESKPAATPQANASRVGQEASDTRPAAAGNLTQVSADLPVRSSAPPLVPTLERAESANEHQPPESLPSAIHNTWWTQAANRIATYGGWVPLLLAVVAAITFSCVALNSGSVTGYGASTSSNSTGNSGSVNCREPYQSRSSSGKCPRNQ